MPPSLSASKPPKDSTAAAFVATVLLHGAVVFGLGVWHFDAPDPPVSIETSFVSQSDIDAIEAQIVANIQAAQTQQASGATTQQSQAQSDLAQREAEYRKQMAQFAAQLDEEATQEMAQLEQTLAEIQAQREQELAEARQAFANQDEEIHRNKEGMDKARLAQEETLQALEAEKTKQGGKSGSLDQGETTNPSSSTSAGDRGTENKTTSSASSGKSRADLAEAIRRHIMSHWHTNALSGSVSATISVNAAGEVTQVRFSNPNSPLVPSLESAIYNASPITPLVGQGLSSVKVNFSTD